MFEHRSTPQIGAEAGADEVSAMPLAMSAAAVAIGCVAEPDQLPFFGRDDVEFDATSRVAIWSRCPASAIRTHELLISTKIEILGNAFGQGPAR